MTGRFVNIEEVEKFVKNIKELKSELAKYKRTFEILKEKGIFEIDRYSNLGTTIYKAYSNERYLEQEEYELLEELMNK